MYHGLSLMDAALSSRILVNNPSDQKSRWLSDGSRLPQVRALRTSLYSRVSITLLPPWATVHHSEAVPSGHRVFSAVR